MVTTVYERENCLHYGLDFHFKVSKPVLKAVREVTDLRDPVGYSIKNGTHSFKQL